MLHREADRTDRLPRTSGVALAFAVHRWFEASRRLAATPANRGSVPRELVGEGRYGVMQDGDDARTKQRQYPEEWEYCATKVERSSSFSSADFPPPANFHRLATKRRSIVQLRGNTYPHFNPDTVRYSPVCDISPRGSPPAIGFAREALGCLRWRELTRPAGPCAGSSKRFALDPELRAENTEQRRFAPG